MYTFFILVIKIKFINKTKYEKQNISFSYKTNNNVENIYFKIYNIVNRFYFSKKRTGGKKIKYERAELDVMNFDVEDVITTSGSDYTDLTTVEVTGD